MGVVLFDAGGTLFEVRGSVGEVYAAAARTFGHELDPRELDREFVRAFGAEGPLVFPGVGPGELAAAERGWWFRIVRQVLRGRMPEAQMKSVFDSLYDLFRRPEVWHVFPDVPPALEWLRRAGHRLGVVSNFDSRLDDVLQSLGLADCFEHVVVSSRAGAAKPDPAIFRRALELFDAAPADALHVGDAPEEDVAGAGAAGIRAVLLDRRGRYAERGDVRRVRSLAELCARLEAGFD
jgi:putative hydrolase of the HAD superfamily